MAKQLVGIRVSDTGKYLLDTLQGKMGLTQAGVVEQALRELAKREQVEIPQSTPKKVKQGT